MKKPIFIIILIAGVIISLKYIIDYHNLHSVQRVRDIRVIDGDTVEFSNLWNRKVRVRLIGIDCYESCKIDRAYRQAYENNLTIEQVMNIGKESTSILEDYILNNKDPLYIETTGKGKYGRTLGILYAGEVNINKYMIEKGKCMEYTFNDN